jgi:hypothetical protein
MVLPVTVEDRVERPPPGTRGRGLQQRRIESVARPEDPLPQSGDRQDGQQTGHDQREPTRVESHPVVRAAAVDQPDGELGAMPFLPVVSRL